LSESATEAAIKSVEDLQDTAEEGGTPDADFLWDLVSNLFEANQEAIASGDYDWALFMIDLQCAVEATMVVIASVALPVVGGALVALFLKLLGLFGMHTCAYYQARLAEGWTPVEAIMGQTDTSIDDPEGATAEDLGTDTWSSPYQIAQAGIAGVRPDRISAVVGRKGGQRALMVPELNDDQDQDQSDGDAAGGALLLGALALGLL